MQARVRAQILNLLKCIHLVRPAGASRPSDLFFPGVHPPFAFPTGISVAWWRDERAHAAQRGVASLLVGSAADFEGCDQETARDAVLDTLKEACNDSDIFHADDVVFAKSSTLFESLRADLTECADQLFARMQRKLSQAIGRCCTVFLVPRLKLPSFSIENHGIHIVEVGDGDAWRRILNMGFVFSGWEPGVYGPGTDAGFSPPTDYSSALLVDGKGTRSGIQFLSILKVRAFLAVTSAVASRNAAHASLKGGIRTHEYCAQFPHVSNPQQVRWRSDTEPLFPNFLEDVTIDQLGALEICRWFTQLDVAPTDVATRIEKAAHFLNLGLNTGGTGAFVNFFVALDALLGRRGAVENSILEGLERLGFEEADINRAQSLFQLRNELVHGGSRYVEEWTLYPRYLRRFRSSPMRDVQRIAETAVLLAPDRLY